MPTSFDLTNIKHPNTFLLQSGSTELTGYINAINQSIRLILTTAVGELWGDPEFGTHLYEYIFEYEGAALTNMIKLEIVRALSLWEPRILISDSDISVTYSGTDAIINLIYNIRYTDYRENYQYIVNMKEGQSL